MSVLLGVAKPRDCRWVIGEANGADTKICGRKVKGHGSWCTRHHTKVYPKDQKHAKAKMHWYANKAGRLGRG